MWFLKEAARKVTDATTSVLSFSKEIVNGPQDPLEDLLFYLCTSQQEHIPTTKLEQLVTFSYDMEDFQRISSFIFKNVRIFKYSDEGIKKALNLLVVITYLIKHGASGFIDEFRNSIEIFQNYQKLQIKIIFDDHRSQKNFEADIQNLKAKAKHIQVLLTDKAKLLKQKELAMLIKQKMKLYQQKQVSKMKEGYTESKKLRTNEQSKTKKNPYSSNSSNQSKTTSQRNRDKQLKVNDLLQTYIWRYVDRLDDKLQNATEKVLKKLDQYVDQIVDGEIPSRFEMQDDIQQEVTITEKKAYVPLESPKDNLIQNINKQIQKIQIKKQDNTDLLSFEEQKKEIKPIPKIPKVLPVFSSIPNTQNNPKISVQIEQKKSNQTNQTNLLDF